MLYGVGTIISVENILCTCFSGTQAYAAFPVVDAILHAPSGQLLQQIEGHQHPYSTNRLLSIVDQDSMLSASQ